MFCDVDFCLGFNAIVCIDTKCDIVFMILQVINDNYINDVNSAMLPPPSLMVLIPLLY